MTAEKIQERIAQLEKLKQDIVTQANQQIGYADGQIALLKELLAERDDAAKPNA